MRVEHLTQPEDYIHEILRRVKREYITRTYGITDWDASDHIDFLEKLAQKAGRLLKGGEADICTVRTEGQPKAQPPYWRRVQNSCARALPSPSLTRLCALFLHTPPGG